MRMRASVVFAIVCACGGVPKASPAGHREEMPPTAVADASSPSPSPTESSSAPVARSEAPGLWVALPQSPNDAALNMVLFVDVDVIRAHRSAKYFVPLLASTHGWSDIVGAAGERIDLTRQTNWIEILGPSLNADRDLTLVHYSVPDVVVDDAIAVLNKRMSGATSDAGASAAPARAFLRSQPNEVAIVPAGKARALAQVLERRPHVAQRVPERALALLLRDPSRAVVVPSLRFEGVRELRVRVMLDAQGGGATLFVEADCTDSDAATRFRDSLEAAVVRNFAASIPDARRAITASVAERRVVFTGVANEAQLNAVLTQMANWH